jgi:hypothetical protein
MYRKHNLTKEMYWRRICQFTSVLFQLRCTVETSDGLVAALFHLIFPEVLISVGLDKCYV